jgi:methylmalonyl-CoA mutase N-terminal domain/subunit
METRIVAEMKEIETLGGMVKAVETGFIQRKVAQQAYAYEKGLQTGEYVKVGSNKYTDGDDQGDTDVELHEYNEQWVEQQQAGLRELKRTRDNQAVTQTLKALEKAAREGDNVMPYLVDCCRAYATVGEMAGIFRNVFGEWEEPAIF